MFILHPFCFLSLEYHQGLIYVHLSVPLVFHHWDNFLGSIKAHSFFPFVTNHWDMIVWFLMVWTPSRFYGSLFFLPLVCHLWDDILGSIKGHSFFPSVCYLDHAPYTILGSIIVYSSSLLFHIIATPSRFYLSSFICSTRFLSLGQLSRFNLSSFLFFHL